MVDYSNVERSSETWEDHLRVEEERVWGECDQKERRWNLSVHLNQLEPDMEKVSCYYFATNINFSYDASIDHQKIWHCK